MFPRFAPLLFGMQQLKSHTRASHKSPRRRLRKRTVGLVALLTVGGWLGFRHIKAWLTPVQAIVVLGGSLDRESFAAQLAIEHPQLPVWVSSGSNPEYADWLYFEKSGLDPNRVHLDYRAVDTVTNFTTLVNDLKANNIEKVYLVTSSYHMRRAQWIGEIVLGSRGISLEPVVVPSDKPSEPLGKALRDGARAAMWVVSGYSGEDLKPKLP
jgi:uncharacterized SAM-binding protein YcdF (DUF218 family)